MQTIRGSSGRIRFSVIGACPESRSRPAAAPCRAELPAGCGASGDARQRQSAPSTGCSRHLRARRTSLPQVMSPEPQGRAVAGGERDRCAVLGQPGAELGARLSGKHQERHRFDGEPEHIDVEQKRTAGTAIFQSWRRDRTEWCDRGVLLALPPMQVSAPLELCRRVPDRPLRDAAPTSQLGVGRPASVGLGVDVRSEHGQQHLIGVIQAQVNRARAGMIESLPDEVTSKGLCQGEGGWRGPGCGSRG